MHWLQIFQSKQWFPVYRLQSLAIVNMLLHSANFTYQSFVSKNKSSKCRSSAKKILPNLLIRKTLITLKLTGSNALYKALPLQDWPEANS